MADAVPHAYLNALLKMIRQPSLPLSRLNEHWPALEKQIVKQRRTLSNQIAKDDPIRSPVDLLLTRQQYRRHLEPGRRIGRGLDCSGYR
jgi:hypothetical protein